VITRNNGLHALNFMRRSPALVAHAHDVSHVQVHVSMY
jgi:hypothetical protein